MKTNKYLNNRIKAHIRNGKINEACKSLEGRSNKIFSFMYLSKLKRLRRDVQLGLIDHEEYHNWEIKISRAILALLDEGKLKSLQLIMGTQRLVVIGLLSLIAIIGIPLMTYNSMTFAQADHQLDQEKSEIYTEFSKKITSIIANVNLDRNHSIAELQGEYEELYLSKIRLIEDKKLQNSLRYFKVSIGHYTANYISKIHLIKIGMDLNRSLDKYV